MWLNVSSLNVKMFFNIKRPETLSISAFLVEQNGILAKYSKGEVDVPKLRSDARQQLRNLLRYNILFEGHFDNLIIAHIWRLSIKPFL